MKEFFVGQFRVDMGRSQIVDKDAIVSMEPRVLQVLLILAEKQGDVVTHQQLLDRVWKDVSVAPNTLQRCITQLRKALGDSAKLQQVIKTHPKVGYSLIADVNFPLLNDTEPFIEQSAGAVSLANANLQKLNRWQKFALLSVLILIVPVLLYTNSYQSQRDHQVSSLPILKLKALTTTDKKEFSPTFSPDGKYIAFQRYVGFCENELWAKDLEQNKEYLLTKTSGIYGTPSWSPDSQKLAFSNVTHCTLSSGFQGCKDIRMLNFALAKSEPQEPLVVKACDQQDYSAAVWWSDQHIAFFEKIGGASQRLLSLDLQSNQLEELYTVESLELDSLSYSNSQKRLAVTQHSNELQASMAIVDPIDKDIVQVELKPPVGYTSIANWYVNWHPTEAKLITSKGNSIFEIDLNGQFIQHSVPTMQSIYDPIFHPDGKSIVASMGIFDKDIERLIWNENTQAEPEYESLALHRSILSEREAKFEPSGSRVAFISERNGTQQLWLTELIGQSIAEKTYLSEPKQLSFLSGNPQIVSFVWSFDGKLIIALIDGKLNLINLDGQVLEITTDYTVIDIYQAPAEDRVLLEIIEGGLEKVILLNLQSMAREILYQGDVHWAQLSSMGELFVSHLKRKVFRWFGGKVQSLNGIEAMQLSAKFLYSNNRLLLTAKDNTLWQYDLSSQSVKRLFRFNQVLKHVDSVDFENQRVLITSVASTRKELVLFHR
jgi:transcriptional activator of cad operon